MNLRNYIHREGCMHTRMRARAGLIYAYLIGFSAFPELELIQLIKRTL